MSTTDKTSSFKIHIIIGARPNFMKAAPIFHELKKVEGVDVEMVHTGQHYDKRLSQDILDDLEIPAPKINLEVGSGSHAVQTANIMIKYEALCLEEKPDLVIVVGDVNSTIACALTAKKLGLNVAHLESGLRSRDMSMPEEINRLLTDRIADVLWTPSPDGDENLLNEGVAKEKISYVGNLMIDSLVKMKPKIDAVNASEKYGLEDKSYAVVTLHRPSNVDHPDRFLSVMREIDRTAEAMGVKVVFPVHPRTHKMMELPQIKQIVENPRFMLLEPLPYLEFVSLFQTSRFLITDSGGIQEETTFLKVPCFTLRPNTERPITISHGTNRLVEPETLFATVDAAFRDGIDAPAGIQYWDGQGARRVVEDIERRFLKK